MFAILWPLSAGNMRLTLLTLPLTAEGVEGVAVKQLH